MFQVMEEILKIFPAYLRSFCIACFKQKERPEELRIRIEQPLLVFNGRQELFWNEQGQYLQKAQEGAYRIKKSDIDAILVLMSQYSFYAFEEEIKRGFLTIQGGHRVGIAGKATCENGIVKTIRQISFLNIRIAGEKKGCASLLIPYIRNGQSIYNTLLISPPGIGKTTMLRDCIRILSNGEAIGEKQYLQQTDQFCGEKETLSGYSGKKIGIVDERSELAACFLGVPQNDLGLRTDVMDCCPKSEGMLMLLRSMSPEIIGVDELGGQADYEAVEQALHCGCHILGTIHGENMAELKEKPHLKKWVEQGFFERYIFLKRNKNGKRSFEVYNEKMERL
ncbi:stage III sporulation protein AA [Lachnospiraceae bacterium ZAX-1]